MTAMPPSFPGTRLEDADDDDGQAIAAQRWRALTEAGRLVAALAEAECESAAEGEDRFPVLFREADAWRRERAGRDLADLAAVMEPGIAALLTIKARGADPRPAARALWREFVAAREALFAVLSAGRRVTAE